MRAHQLKSALLAPVRRGSRTVLWLPERMHLGNFLYHWLHAWKGVREGRDVVVLATDAMAPWLPVFPRARDLVVTRDRVRLTDRRAMGMHQAWGDDFDEHDLEPFVRDVLASSPSLAQAPVDLSPDDVVVNIRRGDYFSDPRHYAMYAFDVEDYLRRALELTAARRPIGRVHVVSDGLEWCRTHLGWLREHGTDLTFADDVGQRGPATDFASLAHAPRLILTNTTFGYWGAYVSNVLHGGDHADVVAPWFHARIGDFAADQLDPRWQVVTDVRGGWKEPPARSEAP